MHDRQYLASVARDAATTDIALSRLHDIGATPISAIRALVEGRGLSLRDAKSALHSSPTWSSEASAAEALWDEVVDVFESDRDDLGA